MSLLQNHATAVERFSSSAFRHGPRTRFILQAPATDSTECFYIMENFGRWHQVDQLQSSGEFLRICFFGPFLGVAHTGRERHWRIVRRSTACYIYMKSVPEIWGQESAAVDSSAEPMRPVEHRLCAGCDSIKTDLKPEKWQWWLTRDLSSLGQHKILSPNSPEIPRRILKDSFKDFYEQCIVFQKNSKLKGIWRNPSRISGVFQDYFKENPVFLQNSNEKIPRSWSPKTQLRLILHDFYAPRASSNSIYK